MAGMGQNAANMPMAMPGRSGTSSTVLSRTTLRGAMRGSVNHSKTSVIRPTAAASAVVQRNDGRGYFLNPANHTGREQVRPKATNAAHSAPYRPGMDAGVSRAFR